MLRRLASRKVHPLGLALPLYSCAAAVAWSLQYRQCDKFFNICYGSLAIGQRPKFTRIPMQGRRRVSSSNGRSDGYSIFGWREEEALSLRSANQEYLGIRRQCVHFSRPNFIFPISGLLRVLALINLKFKFEYRLPNTTILASRFPAYETRMPRFIPCICHSWIQYPWPESQSSSYYWSCEIPWWCETFCRCLASFPISYLVCPYKIGNVWEVSIPLSCRGAVGPDCCWSHVLISNSQKAVRSNFCMKNSLSAADGR